MDDDEWYSSPEYQDFYDSLLSRSPPFARVYSRWSAKGQQVAFYTLLYDGNHALVARSTGLEIEHVRVIVQDLFAELREDPILGAEVCSFELHRNSRSLERIVRSDDAKN